MSAEQMPNPADPRPGEEAYEQNIDRAWAMAAASDSAETAAVKYHAAGEDAMANYGQQGWLKDTLSEHKNNSMMSRAEAARAEANTKASQGAKAYDKLIATQTSDVIGELSSSDDTRKNRLVKRSIGEYESRTNHAVELGIVALTHMNTGNRRWHANGLKVPGKSEIGDSRAERAKTTAKRVGSIALRALGIGHGRNATTEFYHQLETAKQSRTSAEATANTVASYYDKMKIEPVVSEEDLRHNKVKATMIEEASRSKQERAQAAFNEGLRLATELGEGGRFAQKRTARKMNHQQHIRDKAIEGAKRKASRQAKRYDRDAAYRARKIPARIRTPRVA